jgi:hypothetical protein
MPTLEGTQATLELIGPKGTCATCTKQRGWSFDLTTAKRSIAPVDYLKTKAEAMREANKAAHDFGLTITEIEVVNG